MDFKNKLSAIETSMTKLEGFWAGGHTPRRALRAVLKMHQHQASLLHIIEEGTIEENCQALALYQRLIPLLTSDVCRIRKVPYPGAARQSGTPHYLNDP